MLAGKNSIVANIELLLHGFDMKRDRYGLETTAVDRYAQFLENIISKQCQPAKTIEPRCCTCYGTFLLSPEHCAIISHVSADAFIIES